MSLSQKLFPIRSKRSDFQKYCISMIQLNRRTLPFDPFCLMTCLSLRWKEEISRPYQTGRTAHRKRIKLEDRIELEWCRQNQHQHPMSWIWHRIPSSQICNATMISHSISKRSSISIPRRPCFRKRKFTSTRTLITLLGKLSIWEDVRGKFKLIP